MARHAFTEACCKDGSLQQSLKASYTHAVWPLVRWRCSLFEEGGDWERKNRLKVYEGLFCMACRKFPRAAALFLDSISTFTTYELLPYNNFIFYTVLMSVVALDRVSLKEKVRCNRQSA